MKMLTGVLFKNGYMASAKNQKTQEVWKALSQLLKQFVYDLS